MVSKNVRRTISMVLVLLMVCSSMLFAKGTDYLGHWAEASIQNWIDKGYIKGYPDGTFKPENDITRAEFMTIVNRSFEFTAEAEVSYKDVNASHWAYIEFKRANAAGYIGGFEDGTLRPNNKITREEVAVIITRLLSLKEEKDSKAFLDLKDFKQVPDWSSGAVSAIVDKGYMKLRGKDFAPKLPATRAEVIDVLNRGYLNLIKIKYNEAGTYTAGIVDGSIEINAKDVILEDTTINGNLIIGEAVGSGNVTLKNVIVKGDTIVRGGGINSIIIEDSEIINLIIEKIDGKVRILAKRSTYIHKVDMRSGGKLEARDQDANNFGYIVIAENLSSDEPIILVGNFKNIEVKSGDNEIQIQGGTIKNLVIANTAKGAKVNLASGAKVDAVEINAAARIDGKGKIGTARVNVEGVEIIEPLGEMIKADGVNEVEIIKPIFSGGGGGSGGLPPSVEVSAITVNKTTTTLVAGATETITATVEPSNASNKKVTWSSSDTGVATVDANGKITAVAVGNATITVSSIADSSKKATVGVTVKAAVDKSALTTAIADANTNKTTVTVSTDGSDIDPANKWVTEAEMTAYESAIATAQGVADKADATQTEVDNAAAALATATTTFNGVKKAGTKVVTVDKSALTTAIADANTNKTTVTVSTDGSDIDPANKWVTEAEMTAYESAIATAQGVADKADATQTEVDNAAAALATATTTFNGVKKAGTKVVTVDKSALTTAIADANTNKTTVTVSTDGSDIDPANKWVTEAEMTAYESAIATAQGVADKADATQTEVDNAAAALATATTTFNGVKKAGTKVVTVDKSALTTAIADANTNKTTVTVSTDGSDIDPANKWVTEAEMTAYESAIATAQGVADKADATQTEVDNAAAALATATTTFNGVKKAGTKVVTVDKSALTTAIADANTNKTTVTVSTDGSDIDPANKWVTEAEMTAYESAIATAQGVADKADATQAEVDNELADLATATGVFNTAKKAGTKVAVTDVTLDKSTLNLIVDGATVTLVATVNPSDATNKNIIWTSSDKTIATVADGVVTPVAAGTATITVTTEDGDKTATCEVTVTAATDTKITLAEIPGVTVPVTGAIPNVTEIVAEQYTGTIVWTLGDETFDTPFAAEKSYTATITLTANSGYTLAGVTENFFKVTGATTVSNAADSGIVTAVFPETTSIVNNIKILGTDDIEYTLNNLPKGLSWDESILTMNNFQGKHIHENTLKEITINVVGDANKLTAGSEEALLFNSGITIQGTGKLTLESKHTGRSVYNNMTIQETAKVTINIDKSTKRAVFGDVTVKDSGKLEVNTVGEDISGSGIRVANNIYLENSADIKLNLTNGISTQSYASIASNIPYIEGKYNDTGKYYEKAAYKVVGEWNATNGGYAGGENQIKLTYTVPNSVDKLYTSGGDENSDVYMKIWADTHLYDPSITMYTNPGFTGEGVTSIELSTEYDKGNIIYVKTTIGKEPNKETKYYIITIIRDKAEVAEILADKAALTADSIQGSNTDLDNIKVALKNPLPSNGANGSTIEWASNNTEVVSNDGQTINRPNIGEGNETVTLTATLTRGTLTETKDFVLTVLELEPSTIVFADAGPITKTLGDPAFTNGVSGDGAGTITYSSGNTGVATVDSSSGKVTIVGVGTTVITASKAATASHAAVTNSYTVQVSQQALGGTVTIDGELKFDEELTANISSLTGNSDASTLTYAWKRGDTSIGSNQTYTTVADDIGKTITVEVTSSVETEKVTGTTTGTIGKANGPSAPKVVGTTSGEANEILVVGGEEKITVAIGTNMTADYEYSLDGGTTWNSLASGDITGLTSSITSIQIRVKETTTHEAGLPATCDVTVVAESFTLTYTAETGGTITGTSPQTVSSGGDGTTVTATPDVGYSFVKWSDDVTTAERTDKNVTANITVTAQFKINEYTVTFKDHDGTEIETQTVEHGSGATAPTEPTRTGYTFTGWDTVFSKVTSNLTVKAKYTENAPETFKVTITGDATKTTDYTITGADNLEAVVAGTDLTVTAVTNITVNGDEVATSGTKVIKITEATTITINKQVVTPETYTVTTSGDAVKDTDFEITGAADLTAVAKDTTLTVEALTAITVDGSDLAIGATKDVVITAATDIVINKQIAVDKSALTTAISEAETNKATVTVSTDGKDVDPDNKWVTEAEMTAYTSAIATAQGIADKADATQTEVNNAVTALTTATSTFDTAKKDGIKAVDSRIEVSEIKATSTITAPVHSATIEKPTFEVTEGSPAYFNLGIANWQKKNEEAVGGWENHTTGTFTEGIWRFRVQIRIDDENGKTHKLKKPFTAVVNSNGWTVGETVTIGDEFSYGTVYSAEYEVTNP